ncbi:DUF4255 domain-containing protein [Streptomyces albireticuli]|uniref:Pvc16 N-terminal domain-containing protein n=1 Tax=Streptomyces albireticuli TaxID=1940 RepID=A0A2A2D5G5_9ACTN|nr:DUF4255 domain-containing protein [Streptomyces albireticuli]MCD9196242.1 DUF4255 domain-containing protein [Streptomyces albireticuli]PAU46765.1 hypothetical protein CK936_22480 [Streptomyces albireticuli]
MIHEVDEGLRLLLDEAGLRDSGVEVVFDAPTRDWSARRNAPTVSVYLYDIHEDVTRRQTGSTEVYDGDGHVTGRRVPPRWFALTYMVTAWTTRPQDEHRLLSQVLRCLAWVDVLPPRLRTGSLAELGLGVEIDAAGPSTAGASVADVWSALDGEMKASIEVRVTAPLAGDVWPAGPPVTEGLTVRSAVRVGGDGDEGAGRDGDGDASAGGDGDGDAGAGREGGRRLRYEGVPDPGPRGFAAPRARELPPGRRRRRGGPTP